MNFTSHLNFANPELMENASPDELEEFMQTRMGVPMTIHDAREQLGVLAHPVDSTALLADGAGFLLVNSPSAVEDWTNEKEVAAHYYKESQALLQQLLLGAEVPPLTNHTYRNEEITGHTWVDGIQYGPPAPAVHNDYADFVGDDGISVTKKFTEVIGLATDRRVLGINIWRSVTPAPLERLPLAVCDRTSIDPHDLEYNLNPNAPTPFNGHYCKPNQTQHWSYYSNMTRDESLVFTTYDSHPNNGEAFCPTLHTAAPIPGSEGLEPRQSVEVRFFATLPLPA